MQQKFAVFGNPINHSQSPRIHQLFAQQIDKKIIYDAILTPIHHFEETLQSFFLEGGDGANITLPFKERAYDLVSSATDRAKISRTVNTIKKLSGNQLLGDNTDGIGLLTDLKRQRMLKIKQTILIIGAGGAAQGIIAPLLAENHQIIITNRTFLKAEKLAKHFSQYGDISASTAEHLRNIKIDLIVNATSSSLYNILPPIPSSIIHPTVACYDMFYQKGDTTFMRLAKEHHAAIISDGLGMLVAQAAHAFFLWHSIMPDITPVLRVLREEILRA